MNNPTYKIIGRTRINIDQYDVKVSNKNYLRVKKLAKDFIIRNKISILPVDVLQIAQQNNWLVIPYSRINQEINKIYEDIIYTDWGFTIYVNGRYFIFYDDSIKIASQRFTIAHEMGHIVLSHFESNYRQIEMEANMFAARVLMPLSILEICNIYSVEEIKMLCGVSYSAAKIRLEKLQQQRRQKYNLIDPKDVIINKQFKTFVNEYKKCRNI